MRAHRAVVCATSSALSEAIDHQLRKCPAAAGAGGDVRLIMGANVNPADFVLLLRYMYTGKIAPYSADGIGQGKVGGVHVRDRRRVGVLAQALGLRQLAAAMQVSHQFMKSFDYR